MISWLYKLILLLLSHAKHYAGENLCSLRPGRQLLIPVTHKIQFIL